MRPFRYLRDPLFLSALGLFVFNRSVLEKMWTSGFVHNHVNDLLCPAVMIPPMLWLMRTCGVRAHDHPPTSAEIAIPLLIWGAFFEVLLPLHPFWGRWATADPRDLLCYWIGGTASAWWWRRPLSLRDPDRSVVPILEQ